MPPKKQPQNAFFFFMLDYKKKQEAKGVVFPGGLKDVADACSEEWKVHEFHYFLNHFSLAKILLNN